MPEKTYQYKVKPGLKHNQGTPEEVIGGEIVELTLEQASGFLDKLIPLEKDAQNIPVPPGDAPKDLVDKAGLEKMKVTELKELPEWVLVPDPKPTKKAEIIAAIVELRTP